MQQQQKDQNLQINYRAEYTPKGRIRFEYEASSLKKKIQGKEQLLLYQSNNSLGKSTKMVEKSQKNDHYQQQNKPKMVDLPLQQKQKDFFSFGNDFGPFQSTQEVKPEPYPIFSSKENILIQEHLVLQDEEKQIFLQIKHLEQENDQHLEVIKFLNENLIKMQRKNENLLRKLFISKENKQKLVKKLEYVQNENHQLLEEKMEIQKIMIRLNQEIEINDKNKDEKYKRLQSKVEEMKIILLKTKEEENVSIKITTGIVIFEKIQRKQKEMMLKLSGQIEERFQFMFNQLKDLDLKLQQKKKENKENQESLVVVDFTKEEQQQKSSLIFEFKPKNSKKVIKIKRSKSVGGGGSALKTNMIMLKLSQQIKNLNEQLKYLQHQEKIQMKNPNFLSSQISSKNELKKAKQVIEQKISRLLAKLDEQTLKQRIYSKHRNDKENIPFLENRNYI